MEKRELSLTQGRLKELLHYNPETGIFTWVKGRVKSRGGNAKKGKVAGTAHSAGYIQIAIDKKLYLAHRLAFLYVDGYIPENNVDHINRIRDDNRWCNLREVSQSCNLRNASIRIANTSGVTGVSWDKEKNKWRAAIRASGSNKYLGYFESFDDAVRARWEAEIKYGYPNCNSSSSAYEYLREHNLIQ